MITSTSNGKVKNVIRLISKSNARKEQKLFTAEGIKMFQEAPPDMIEQVFVKQSLRLEEKLHKKLKSLPHEVVSDTVFDRMSSTKTPQGIMTALRQPEYVWEDMLCRDAPLLLVLEDLQDPGNLGTIIRTAEGAGVDGVIMSKGCVDIFNPKTIRSTMGSVYRMPFFYMDDLKETLEILEKENICTYAAHLQGENTYDKENYCRGTAFLIGNEGNGLSPELTAMAKRRIRIPMEGLVESLNAAVASSILTYEAFRQRRNCIDK